MSGHKKLNQKQKDAFYTLGLSDADADAANRSIEPPNGLNDACNE